MKCHERRKVNKESDNLVVLPSDEPFSRAVDSGDPTGESAGAGEAAGNRQGKVRPKLESG
ncbi:hypothetical protein F383_20651 [Gossypium arboreum]|uniref:Uncharacterized protein n=1 Tax=Gossypium arboreum TaxID=29729 RepID=A0A0B0NZS9_GOSAR|nr:hypothetical protein F383_20651 [Gossypium arboreum]